MMCLSDDISISSPINLTEEFYEKWLPKFINGLLQVTFVESYRVRGEDEKITLSIKYQPVLEVHDIMRQIEDLLKTLGT